MANDLLRGRQTLAALTNQSGGSVAAGDVVIISSANASSFTTTTTAGLATSFVGVAVETIAASATGRVCLFGYVPQINLSSSATLGQYVATATVAKQAAPTSTQGAGVFGQVLGTGTSPAAVLFGYPQQAGSGGGGSSGTVAAATAESLSTVSITDNNTWQNLSGMSVAITTAATGNIVAFVTAQWSQVNTNWDYSYFRVLLDGTTGSEQYGRQFSTNDNPNIYWLTSFHTMFASVAAGSHTLQLQWNGLASSNQINIYTQRLTVLSGV